MHTCLFFLSKNGMKSILKYFESTRYVSLSIKRKISTELFREVYTHNFSNVSLPSMRVNAARNSIAGKLETSGPALRCIIEFAFD